MPETLLIALALGAGMYMAWNIGANDVANAFGTAVGSGAVTFRKALILAAIFEFGGAFLAGAPVANTIKGNILNMEAFAVDPHIFAVGMLASILAASLWLNVATYLSQPVSTTHAIIGAVIGFGVVAVGPEHVQWGKLLRIAASWVVSPVCGGFIAFLVYNAIRRAVLRNSDPIARARAAVPLGFGATVYVMAFATLQHHARPLATALHAHSDGRIALLAFLPAILGGLGAWAIVRSRKPTDAPVYERVESWFSRLQIITACYMSFAHGANDVANAIGPVAGILQALKGSVQAKTPIPTWILLFGGVGIVAGLASYGHKVITAVGRKITEVTPTRGFAAEFSTATTVVACSLMGLPISTTFVLVGAVMGVGFARGFGAIDLRVVNRIFISWAVTLPISGVLSALLYLALRRLW